MFKQEVADKEVQIADNQIPKPRKEIQGKQQSSTAGNQHSVLVSFTRSENVLKTVIL